MHLFKPLKIESANPQMNDFPPVKSCACMLSRISHVQLSAVPWPANPFCPWDSPGKNIGVGGHALLQGIFLTQGLNPHLLCLLNWQVGSLWSSPIFTQMQFRTTVEDTWSNLVNLKHFIFNFMMMQFYMCSVQFSPVAQSCPTLQPHETQHVRPPCPSPTPGVHPNPCPSSRWCHPTISSSVIPFSSCPQSFPASGSFQMSQFFASGGQSIGVSGSTSVLPMCYWKFILKNSLKIQWPIICQGDGVNVHKGVK